MSETSVHKQPAHFVADCEPLTIGRGTGFTIKELRAKLDACMKRLNVPSAAWRHQRILPPRMDTEMRLVRRQVTAVRDLRRKVHHLFDLWRLL